ncbi:class I SAM-dependent methyltransferase [Janthinobacterium sp. 17J80-10]|uniref:class I SAM-dependent methyltransferase n=1 Tax=Janthinobacterium sp. 17J80-10 TaxID=2497863 RepID=UPI0010055A13|nr:class I SAM-dependent methyltransferase [Janthinobacterium sp. 17J80-10]QAU33630.1 class I SAM-dependent methyltransferase [Janthinobacterium sp. 17J80-10]
MSNSAAKNIGIAPAGYHQLYYADRDWHSYASLLAMVVKYSEPGPILDLGAGCGYFVEAGMQWGLQCVGIDGAHEAIELATSRAPEIDIKLHKLSEPLPFQDHSFQTIVMNQVIEHLEPSVLEMALLEAFRVLRPGGTILILSPSAANKNEWDADPTHINLLSPSELRNVLVKSGFEKIIPFDNSLNLLGNSRFARGMMYVLFKLLKLDMLSATANAVAYKPRAGNR